MVRRTLDREIARKTDLLDRLLGALELMVKLAYLLEALLDRAATPHRMEGLVMLNGLLREVTRKRLDALAEERELKAVDRVDPL